MENYCTSICKYHPESPEEACSDDIQADHHEYPAHADDVQYFDIDISSPLPPITDTTRIRNSGTSSDEDHSDDEFEFNFSICSTNPPNPNHCLSPADNLFYQGRLLPLQLIPPPLEYDIDINDIHASLHSSSNVPVGVRTHFSKLLKTATKLKISLFGFRKPTKVGLDLQSSCAERGSDIGMDSPVPKQNKLLTLKLKVVEVPLMSLFTGDNFKAASAKRDGSNGFQKKSEDSDDGEGQCKNMDRDKKKAKEIVQKYVKKIKPLYVKISQRCNEKIIFGDLEKPAERNGLRNGRCPGSERSEKLMSLLYFPGNLKMVYKHLGKGKQQPSEMQQKLPNYYTSESTLMELQSAIQGAITHCKQSIYIDGTPNCPNFGCSVET